MRFGHYRRLWQQAEADRRAADADARAARETLFRVAEQMSALCDHFEQGAADPEVRGIIRKLRHEVERSRSVLSPPA